MTSESELEPEPGPLPLPTRPYPTPTSPDPTPTPIPLTRPYPYPYTLTPTHTLAAVKALYETLQAAKDINSMNLVSEHINNAKRAKDRYAGTPNYASTIKMAVHRVEGVRPSPYGQSASRQSPAFGGWQCQYSAHAPPRGGARRRREEKEARRRGGPEEGEPTGLPSGQPSG